MRPNEGQILTYPILVVGGSTAAYSATLGALQGGGTVCLVQPQQVIGGQFTAQGLPASDDGKLVATQAGGGRVEGETFAISRSQRQFRQRQRELQTLNGKVVANPGGGWVSHLTVTPTVAAQVLDKSLAEYITEKQLVIIPFAEPVEVLIDHSPNQRRRVKGVVFQDSQNGCKFTVRAQITIEATDLGDLLELGPLESRVGQESRHDTGEAVLPDEAFPLCQQAITFCAVVEKTATSNGVPIGAPPGYDRQPWLKAADFTSRFWMRTNQHPPWKKQDFFDDWGIFTYRRLLRSQVKNSPSDGDVTVINWGTSPRSNRGNPPSSTGEPLCCGNDYQFGVLVGVSREERQENIRRARDRAQAYIHFLQTSGISLKPRGDLTWTVDGIALEPYIREARRGIALTTIRHEDVAQKFFPDAARARCFQDSVGIGQYHYLDFHPNNAPSHVDLDDGKISLPFTIALSALIPINTDGLILSAKSIGTTHITNAAYRMHPVEWAIGEAGGQLAAFALREGVGCIATDRRLTRKFQGQLARQGIPLFWFDDLGHDDPDFEAIQVLAVAGIIPADKESLHFDPEGTVTRGRVAVAITNLFEVELSYPPFPTFKDVSPKHEVYTSIEALYAKGIVVGVGNGRFAPDKPCTREHLAIMLGKLGLNLDEVLSTPTDSHNLKRRELARILYSNAHFNQV